MLKKLFVLGSLIMTLVFVGFACDDEVEFVSGAGTFFGTGILVDGNGMAFTGATVYIPSGNPLGFSAGKSLGSPLAATGSGGTCDDPNETFSAVDCPTETGFFTLPCPSNVSLQVNGEVIFEFFFDCNTDGEDQMIEVPEVFEEPLVYVPLASDVFDLGLGASSSALSVLNTTTDLLSTTLTAGLSFDDKGAIPAILLDVTTAPNGDALITAVNPLALGPFFLGFEEVGKLFIVDSETNAISEIIIDDMFPFNVAVSPDGSKAYVTGGFCPLFLGAPCDFFLGGFPDSLPAPLDIIDLDNKTVAGQVFLPWLGPPPKGDDVLISSDVAFSADGSKAVVSAVLFEDFGCGEGPEGCCGAEGIGCFEPVESGYFILNANVNAITDAGPLVNPAAGEIAINNNKAYIVTSDVIFFTNIILFDGEEGAKACDSIDIIDLSDGENPEPIFLKGPFCTFSAVSSPTQNEVYVGAYGKGSLLFTVNTTSDEIAEEPADLGDKDLHVHPFGLGINPDGDKVYIAFATEEGGGESGCDSIVIPVYDPATNDLTETRIDLDVNECEVIFGTLFSIAGQGVSN